MTEAEVKFALQQRELTRYFLELMRERDFEGAAHIEILSRRIRDVLWPEDAANPLTVPELVAEYLAGGTQSAAQAPDKLPPCTCGKYNYCNGARKPVEANGASRAAPVCCEKMTRVEVADGRVGFECSIHGFMGLANGTKCSPGCIPCPFCDKRHHEGHVEPVEVIESKPLGEGWCQKCGANPHAVYHVPESAGWSRCDLCGRLGPPRPASKEPGR